MFTFIKKMALTGSMVLLGAGGVGAQQQSAQQHINRYSLLQPFVPEGILVERSPASLLRNTLTIDPERFSYLRQDTSHWNHFVEFYRFWQPASYQASRFPLVPDTLSDAAERAMFGGQIAPQWQQRQIQNEVVLGGMLFNYREFADDALDSMYVYYDQAVDKFRLGLGSITFTDTIWTDPNNLNSWSIQTFNRSFNNQITLQRWSNIKPFFMLAAHTQSANVSAGQPVRFVMPTNLFFGSWAGSTLQIDFDNGAGYQTVAIGQQLQITYAQAGQKWIKYRVLNPDGGASTITPGVISLTVGHLRIGNPSHLFLSGQQSCISFSGIQPGIAAAFIRTAPQNQGKLMKPFVLVEGIEMESVVKGNPTLVKASAEGFGDFTWSHISSGNYGPGREHLAELTNFLDSINRAGYDVVFVDFLTNRAKIEANAVALSSLLVQINQQLMQNGSKSNIELIGASMGGLIARVALRQMELQGCCHNVKLFTTYATPHMGANVPLSMQLGLKDAAYRLNFLGMGNEVKAIYENVLNSPAARQMLYYHAESSASADREAFTALMDQLGWPREPRKGSVTNGNIFGVFQSATNEIGAPILVAGMRLFLETREVWVPTNFPLPNNARNYRNAGTNGMYLSRNEGFVMPHSPQVASNALIYRAGKDVIDNFSDVANAHLTYATGMFRFVKRGIAIGAAAAAAPPLAPGIIAAGAIKLTAMAVIVDRSLQSLFNSNINSNLAHNQQYAAFPTLGVDFAPGDYSQGSIMIQKSIFSKSATYSNHTFVPSTSSLSISNNDLLSPVDAFALKSLSNSFDGLESLYIPQDVGFNLNDKHVSVNSLIVSMLRFNQQSTQSSRTQPNLTHFVNAARPIAVNNTLWAMNADVELAPWRIGNGGHLGINLNQPVNVTGQPLFGINRPAPNFHFVTKTSTFDCDSVPVIVEQGGTLELGDIQPGNALTAEVYFREASSLTLHAGSRLRINNRSHLIIERGSSLIVHPGAQIELLGDSAILEIRGRVILLDNAQFTFSGSGFVRINQNPGLLNSRWSFGQGSGIRLTGLNRSDKVLEVVGEFRLLDTAAYIEILNARVDLMSNARLNTHSKVRFENVHFTGQPNRTHQGVMVHGQPHCVIKNCLITNGNVGLSAYLLTYTNPLLIEQVEFSNNNTGLETFGRSAQLTQCTGRSNNVFWRGYDIEGISRVRDCRIVQNQEGIHVMGQHGAQLEILESRLDSNDRGLMAFGDLRLKPFCSSFNHNQIGIYAGNTQLLMGGNANNSFLNNHTAIYLEEIDNLFIVNGYNNFAGSTWYITGRFTGIAHQYLSTIPNVLGYFLNVANNRMPLINQQIPIDLEDGDGNSVLVTNWTFMSHIPLACVRTASADYDYWVLNSVGSTRPVEINGVSKTLPLALLDAVELVSKNEIVANPQDLLAVQMFQEIFNSIRSTFEDPLSKEEVLILDLALVRMIEAVSNSYKYALLQPARGDEEFPLSNIIAWTIAEIQHRLNEANASANFEVVNKLKLKMAHVYRIGEYYKEALLELNDVIANSSWGSDIHTQAIYWHCVCEAEMALVKGEINAEEFEALRAPCLQNIPEMRQAKRTWKLQNLFDPHASKSFKLNAFPNPVTDLITLEQFADNGQASIQISNAFGQVVLNTEWKNPYERAKVDVRSLPQGFYIVEVITTTGKKAQVKLVKR